MSNKLRWCLNFLRASYLVEHKRWRTRKKNFNRLHRMQMKAFKRWGSFPIPDEWSDQYES